MFAGIYLKLIAAAVIVAAVLGGYMYVKHLQNENQRLTQELAIVGSKLSDQNAAVARLKTESDERLAAAQKDLQLAQAEAAKGKNRARVIYKSVPSTPGDDCKSALDLMNGVDVESQAKLLELNSKPATEKAALDLLNGAKK